MVGRWARLALLIIAFVGAADAAWAEKRVALVIGNNDYQNFGALTNPVNDAENLKNALQSINFDVVFFKNTTLRQFYQALKEFNKRAKDADVAIVYYAGHAVQFHGRNYLIQVDDEAETLDDINIGSIPVEKVMDILATVKGVKVLVLDACRDNPAKGAAATNRSIGTELTRDVGLARLDDYDTSGGGGMVIAYATSASHVAEDGQGKNSLYNIALTKWITAADLTIPDIFTNVTGDVVAATNKRQHPIFDSSLTGKYILNPTGSEWVDWANVQGSSDVDKLQHFLDAHPDSAHAPFVRHQLDVLQRNLAEATWDRIKDSADLAALQSFKDRYPASPHAADADQKISALKRRTEDAERESQAWERARTANDLGSLQAFRSAYPSSTHAAEADLKIASLKQASDEQERAEAAWKGLKTTDAAALQAFRSAFPNSTHAAEAAERIADLQRKAADAQREAAEWGRARDQLDPAALQRFLDRYPNSQYSAEAERKLAEAQQRVEVQRSERAWDSVKGGTDIGALERFRDTYPTSPHAAEVDQKIAAVQEKAETERSEKAWAQVKAGSDLAGLRAFRDRYPNSTHAAEADQRIGALLQPSRTAPQLDQDDAWWDRVKTSNSRKELESFKHFFPNSRHLAEADKLIAAIDSAADAQAQKAAQSEQEEKRKQAEAEEAKRQEETCKREVASVADFVKARSADALTALRGRVTCPQTYAAIDDGLRAVKSQVCASERDQAREIKTDLEALRRAVVGFSCEAEIAAARSRIAQLEQDKTREATACEDAKFDIDNKIDGFEAGARDKFARYLTRTECPAALAAAQVKIAEVDDRVAAAQARLRTLGCYKAEPPSLRFDRETQDAVARFQRGAHRDVDSTHLTPDFMQTLATFTGDGACPTSTPPPPVAEREPQIPRVERRPEPVPRIERPRVEVRTEPSPRPERRLRTEPVPNERPAPRAEPQPARPRRQEAVDSARREAPAPKRSSPPAGGGDRVPFIPTPF